MSGPGFLEKVRFDQEAEDQKIRDEAARTARIREMLTRWRAKLNLTDWDIRFDPAAIPSLKRHAEITYSFSDKAAVISLQSYLDFQEAEAAVVHELLHPVLKPYIGLAERLTVHVRDDQSRTTLTEMLDDAEEEVIETLVRALHGLGPRVLGYGDSGQAEVWAVFK